MRSADKLLRALADFLSAKFAPIGTSRDWPTKRDPVGSVPCLQHRRPIYVASTDSYSDNKVSSVMGRDDSWPAAVPSVVPTGDCSH